MFRIQHRDPQRKQLVVHFNHLNPYLLSDRDDAQEEGREQLRKQKDSEKDHSVPGKEGREVSMRVK